MKPDSKHFSLRAVAILALFAAITILAMRTGLAAPQAQAEEPEPTPTPLPTDPSASPSH